VNAYAMTDIVRLMEFLERLDYDIDYNAASESSGESVLWNIAYAANISNDSSVLLKVMTTPSLLGKLDLMNKRVTGEDSDTSVLYLMRELIKKGHPELVLPLKLHVETDIQQKAEILKRRVAGLRERNDSATAPPILHTLDRITGDRITGSKENKENIVVRSPMRMRVT